MFLEIFEQCEQLFVERKDECEGGCFLRRYQFLNNVEGVEETANVVQDSVLFIGQVNIVGVCVLVKFEEFLYGLNG